MKKTLKYRTILSAICIVVATALSSCSEWTDTESLTIKNPTIEEANPELYAQYLAALVTYKQSDHKVVYVTFDNSNKVPGTRGEHINIVPDSVDIISLMSPDNLTEGELADIAKARTKSTKIVYAISYEQIEAMFVPATPETPAVVAEEGEGEEVPELSEFDKFLTAELDRAIKLCDTYNYDGITLSYNGRYILTMPPADKAAYIASQNIVIAKIKEWAAANESKMFIFEGLPMNLIDRSMLELCDYMIIPTQDLKSLNAMNQVVLQSLVSGVPTTNIILATRPFSLNKDDYETGYLADGTSAMHSAAYWIVTDDTRYTKAGLAIYGVQSDYYNRTSIYPYTRRAIDIMNPSAKN